MVLRTALCHLLIPKAVGSVAGIVGAGGNVGAMLIGFLFKSISYASAFLYLGLAVFMVGIVVLAVRLTTKRTAENKWQSKCSCQMLQRLSHCIIPFSLKTLFLQ
jgi:nitrate/nitrite transporter NarK